MSKSLIQTANQSPSPVAVGGTIPLGTVLRRFGCNCRLSGNAVEIEGAGYYTISGTVTLAPTAIGNVTVSVQCDNVPISGATVTGSVSTVGNSVTLPVETTVRLGCCCEGASQLSLVLTEGASTLESVSLRVEKV